MGFKNPLNLPPGSITGSLLAADAIDGKTITGAFIRTAATGTRWEIDSPGHSDEIRGYTGHVAETFPAYIQVSPSSGGLLYLQGPDLGAGSPSIQLAPGGALVTADQGVTLVGNAAGTAYVLVDPNGIALNTAAGKSVSTSGDLVVGGTLRATGAVYSVAYTGTTDASGFLVVTHGAGFTPAGGWAMTTNPAASFAYPWGIDSIGATTVRLRFTSVNAFGALASTAVAGRLFLIRP